MSLTSDSLHMLLPALPSELSGPLPQVEADTSLSALQEVIFASGLQTFQNQKLF